VSLLSLSGISASYASAPALYSVDLDIAEGEVVALMGRNGSGKTTTIKCICRMLPSVGDIRFATQDITNMPSHRVARLGIGLVPEGRRCFSALSVTENLIAAARPGDWTLDKVIALFPVFGERRNQIAASLSGGEQQMLAIARALMTNPRLLILDEATEGLAPLVRQEIWRVIAELKTRTGLAILVVDKSIAELSRVCDRATLIERGSTVWHGAMDELDSETTERYLGV